GGDVAGAVDGRGDDGARADLQRDGGGVGAAADRGDDAVDADALDVAATDRAAHVGVVAADGRGDGDGRRRAVDGKGGGGGGAVAGRVGGGGGERVCAVRRDGGAECVWRAVERGGRRDAALVGADQRRDGAVEERVGGNRRAALQDLHSRDGGVEADRVRLLGDVAGDVDDVGDERVAPLAQRH